MRASTQSWSWTLAASVVLGACGSSSSGGSVVPAGDGGHAGDAAAADARGPDGVSPFDAGGIDGPGSPEDASVDVEAGPACTIDVALSTSPTCNACVESYCDLAWCTCAQDTANVDDAGDNGCERYVTCVSECVQSDAGLPTTCTETVCAHDPYSTIEQQEGRALLNCVVLHCSNECPE